MDLCTTENQRIVKIELEAAEALAGLAHFPAVSNGSNSYEETTTFMVKKPEKSGIMTSKSMKDEQNTKLGLSTSLPTNCVLSGRKSRQNLTEAEIEARKIRRVLANRESARQTIRRRQAVFEELQRKSIDLAWENEKLKREKDSASKQYDSLKTKNECLKAQMTKITNNEVEETREESITTNEPSISTSSTNSPFIIYNQPSFLPFVWPQLQCGSPAGIVFPSVESPSCEGNSVAPLYLLPYPWLVTLPQNNNENHHPHSFNLNDKPKECFECQQFFPEKDTETPTCPVSCEELVIKAPADKHVVDQVPGKRSCDTAAATEARKRRKQLTRLKNHFHCRQVQMY
ncbi:uncharacterized protein LOC143543148 [Bidens hawaiensis]|uniref:uncharacterized protein LOC143543148 n=1 Tax=Bidens hawaiensis TaxID=980011 RepID=UPI00404BA191